jgi:hypothetical protein
MAVEDVFPSIQRGLDNTEYVFMLFVPLLFILIYLNIM